MKLEIVSPERVLLNNEVSSLTVPGEEGRFQMLDHHAAIVSILEEGYLVFKTKENLSQEVRENFIKGSGDELTLKIKGGVVEMKNNKAIVLVD